MQTESGIRNKRQLVPNVFKNNFNEKFEKKKKSKLRPYLSKSCRIIYCFFSFKDKLITSAWDETCRTSWTPCSSVLDASHANAPTHQITLNADTQLYGVIPIYKPPERQLSLCRAYFFRSISISKSISACRRKVFHKLTVALHCWRSFKLISDASLHPAFKPSDGSQIKVSQRVWAAHLLLYPHAGRGCCPRHVLHMDDKISDRATTGGMSLGHSVHSGV